MNNKEIETWKQAKALVSNSRAGHLEVLPTGKVYFVEDMPDLDDEQDSVKAEVKQTRF